MKTFVLLLLGCVVFTGFAYAGPRVEMKTSLGIEMPVTENVYEALEHGKDPRECVRSLMSREPKLERPAGEDRGSWGATLVILRPAD